MIDVVTTLQSKNIRATPARQKVLEYFTKIKNPVSVDQMQESAKIKRLALDTVTLYRIIHLFTEKNILREIDLHEGKFRYEIFSQEHHHHIVCTHCGKIQDVDPCLPEGWKKKLEKSTHYQIATHSLEFFGLCKSCQ